VSAVTKVLYKPLSLAASVAGGILAGAVFTKVWSQIGDGGDAPEADDLKHTTREVLMAAAVHGAVFGLVRAGVDRASAKGYRKVTGENPG